MIVDFDKIKREKRPSVYCGCGEISIQMDDDYQKVALCTLYEGASIGEHFHYAGECVYYVVSGTGVAVCDGEEEKLTPGVCHVCLRSGSHYVYNNGKENLVLFAVITK